MNVCIIYSLEAWLWGLSWCTYWKEPSSANAHKCNAVSSWLVVHPAISSGNFLRPLHRLHFLKINLHATKGPCNYPPMYKALRILQAFPFMSMTGKGMCYQLPSQNKSTEYMRPAANNINLYFYLWWKKTWDTELFIPGL